MAAPGSRCSASESSSPPEGARYHHEIRVRSPRLTPARQPAVKTHKQNHRSSRQARSELANNRGQNSRTKPTGTVPGEQSRSLTARRWLFERISGTPADLAPGAYAVTTADQRSRLDKFAVFVTPGLVASLDSYAGTWLEGKRIYSEEVTLRPPASPLTGLYLPRPH